MKKPIPANLFFPFLILNLNFTGITYFFKGKGFWKFNDLRMRVENEKQMPSAQFWMGCPPSQESDTTDDPSLPPIEPRINISASVSLKSCIYVIILSKLIKSILI